MTYDGRLAPSETNLTHIKRLTGYISSASVLLWLYLVLPELTKFTDLIRTLSPFNLILLFSAAIVLLIQSIRRRDAWGFSLEPRFQGPPLFMMFGAAIASVLARWFLDLEHLSVVGFIVGAYGLIGLFCHVRSWKRGIPFMAAFVILIFLFALEFTDLGHLARTSIAEIVEFLLKPFSVDAISSEDILVLSTGIAFVDIPCSGIKNIEIGSLFFIAASLLERKQMGLRWFMVSLINLALLITANIARILVIVVLTFIMQQQPLAEILHVPLGLFGFIAVCLITLQLLRFVPRQPPSSSPPAPDRLPPPPTLQTPAANLRNAALTLSLLTGLALIPHPNIADVSPKPFNTMQWPKPMQTQAIDLNRFEEKFFTHYPGVVTQKQTFQFKGVSGSMIFVASPTWQAHHAPELCFSASGLEIDHMQKQALTSQVTGRWLSLNQGQQQAAYWFQSSQRTTDRYLDRIWSEITRQESNWTLVSILFDQPVSADNTDVQTMVEEVHSAIAAAMT